MKKREEMIKDIHCRIDKYETEQKRKRAKITKVVASVTPVCAATIVGVGLWKSGSLVPSVPVNDYVISNVETSVSDNSNKFAEDETSKSVLTSTTKTGDSVQKETDTPKVSNDITTEEFTLEIAPENIADVPENANADVAGEKISNTQNIQQNTDEVANIEQPITSPIQQTEKPENRLTISSYPSGYASMSIPGNGSMGYGIELYKAIEEYSINADYSVKIDLFSESEQIFDSEKIKAEADRLVALGYDITVESEPMQAGEPYYYLTMKLTYEQIKDFPITAEFGYAMRLYDESI